MRATARVSAVGVLVWISAAAIGHAQTLAPLGDEVSTPLLPTGVSSADVEMFGELVYLWDAPDGAKVVHFVGDFELQLGRRRLNAQQAVIWVVPRTYDRLEYTHLEIVLWRDARVREPAGTITRGPALYVTLNTAGGVRTSADQTTRESSADTAVYQRAERIREVMARSAEAESDLAPAVTVVDLGRSSDAEADEVRPPISYQGDDLSIEQIDGRQVATVIGNVYVFRGADRGADEIEIRADAAVVYFAQPAEKDAEKADVGPIDDRPGRARPGAASEPGVAPDATEEGLAGLGGGGQVEGVYLEGDIILSAGPRVIRASRLYYDFAHDRALVLDAILQLYSPERNLPIYVRADMVRQLSAREFAVRRPMVSTSEFHTPHYHVAAAELNIIDRRVRDPLMPQQRQAIQGTLEMTHTTFNVGGVPLMYWPYAKIDVDSSDTGIRSIRTGYSDDFGVEFESRWDLFTVLGLDKPEGVNGNLLVDYYSNRGPAVGLNLDYETDNSFGLYRGYYINDRGEDSLGGRFRDEQPDTESRGRTTLRHREYLPDDWQLTFELSYISDKNFLEEYFQSEFDNGKDQETLLYLKKQVDNWAFNAVLQYRLMDFVTTTERLPDFSFLLIGEPVGRFGTLFSENRAGWVRYRPAELGFVREWQLGMHGEDASGTTARADTRQEVEFPFAVGDFKLVPFASVRGSAWDDSPRGSGVGRLFGTYGLRGSVYASRVYPEVRSELFDLDGIRHIVKLDAVAWAAHSNRDPRDLYPFDETVENIEEADGVSIGLRQRWQTKRGAAGAQRTVDVLLFDVELGVFNDADGDEYTNGFTSPTRPENSIARNYLNTAVVYRLNDETDLASEMNYDINDGEVDIFTLTYGVQRTPRLSYLVGYRYLGEQQSNLLGIGVNYRASEKYTLAVREEFDLDRGETAEFDIGVIRKFPRWFVAVTFSVDEIEDDFGVSLSAWPEGLPQAALGNRRFTGLVTSTGIRPGVY